MTYCLGKAWPNARRVHAQQASEEDPPVVHDHHNIRLCLDDVVAIASINKSTILRRENSSRYVLLREESAMLRRDGTKAQLLVSSSKSQPRCTFLAP